MSLSGGSGRIIVTVDPDLEDLVPAFLVHRRADVQAIHDALQQHDYRTIHRLGHNLRGDGGAPGFHELSVIGHSLERAALDQDAAAISGEAERLADYLERVEVVSEDTQLSTTRGVPLMHVPPAFRPEVAEHLEQLNATSGERESS